jgi:aldehyde:ferredoxin oxidoreductase
MDGWWVFIDCLGVCRFITIDPGLTIDCLNAATGRGFTLPDIMTIGRRIINQLRVFNFRHGLDPALEAPSFRYGSTPTDGPAQGKAIGPYFEWMTVAMNYRNPVSFRLY